MKKKTKASGFEIFKKVMIAIRDNDQNAFNQSMNVFNNEKLGNQEISLFKLFEFLADNEITFDNKKFKEMNNQWECGKTKKMD